MTVAHSEGSSLGGANAPMHMEHAPRIGQLLTQVIQPGNAKAAFSSVEERQTWTQEIKFVSLDGWIHYIFSRRSPKGSCSNLH